MPGELKHISKESRNSEGKTEEKPPISTLPLSATPIKKNDFYYVGQQLIILESLEEVLKFFLEYRSLVYKNKIHAMTIANALEILYQALKKYGLQSGHSLNVDFRFVVESCYQFPQEAVNFVQHVVDSFKNPSIKFWKRLQHFVNQHENFQTGKIKTPPSYLESVNTHLEEVKEGKEGKEGKVSDKVSDSEIKKDEIKKELNTSLIVEEKFLTSMPEEIICTDKVSLAVGLLKNHPELFEEFKGLIGKCLDKADLIAHVLLALKKHGVLENLENRKKLCELLVGPAYRQAIDAMYYLSSMGLLNSDSFALLYKNKAFIADLADILILVSQKRLELTKDEFERACSQPQHLSVLAAGLRFLDNYPEMRWSKLDIELLFDSPGLALIRAKSLLLGSTSKIIFNNLHEKVKKWGMDAEEIIYGLWLLNHASTETHREESLPNNVQQEFTLIVGNPQKARGLAHVLFELRFFQFASELWIEENLSLIQQSENPEALSIALNIISSTPSIDRANAKNFQKLCLWSNVPTLIDDLYRLADSQKLNQESFITLMRTYRARYYGEPLQSHFWPRNSFNSIRDFKVTGIIMDYLELEEPLAVSVSSSPAPKLS